MSFRSIDYISPKITLFYYGRRRHSSNLGGILTVLMAFFSACYVFYLIYKIFEHKIINFMFYRTFLIDAGQFYFNDTTGIFHFFQLYDTSSKLYGEYNSKYVRIIMSRLYRTYVKNQLNLSDNEHWVYDKCRENIDNKNIDKNVFHDNSFNSGICLRYYYDNQKHMYYPIEDIYNFKYPYLIHGSANKDNLFLETVIEKCENSSVTSNILGPCGTKNEMDEFIQKYKGINLQLLFKRVNTDNYKNPIYQYLHSVSESLNVYSVPVDHINLLPYFIEVNTGLFYPTTTKNITCSFELNRRENMNLDNNTKTLAIFDYWLQNSAQVIKGGYTTLYDILPSIGGIIQLIYYIFYSFNYLYNKYITIQDSNKSFFRMYNLEDTKEIPLKKEFIKNVISLRNEIKLKNTNISPLKLINKKNDNNIFISKYNKQHQINKSNMNNNSIFMNIIDDKDYRNDLSNSNDLMENLQKNISKYNIKQNIQSSNNNFIKYYQKNQNQNKNEKISEKKSNIRVAKRGSITILNEAKKNNFSNELNEFIKEKNKSFNVEPLNIKITTKLINFLYFLFYVAKFKRKNQVFFILNQFRQKILGEEHIFKTNIIFYHLEKYFNIKEIKKVDIMELYQNL